jgi:two-component system, NarL family, nitrate/nitrite response regulator NarL
MTLRLEEPPSATVRWADYNAHLALPAPWAQVLSPAERAVTAHLCRGLSNREIAAVLGKSPATVKNQVSAILGKIGVPTRTRLIALLR